MNNELLKLYRETTEQYWKARISHINNILVAYSALLGALVALCDNSHKTSSIRTVFALAVATGALGILLTGIGSVFDCVRLKRLQSHIAEEYSKSQYNFSGMIVSSPPKYLLVTAYIGFSFLVFSLLLILVYTLLVNVPEWFELPSSQTSGIGIQ